MNCFLQYIHSSSSSVGNDYIVHKYCQYNYISCFGVLYKYAGICFTLIELERYCKCSKIFVPAVRCLFGSVYGFQKFAYSMFSSSSDILSVASYIHFLLIVHLRNAV